MDTKKHFEDEHYRLSILGKHIEVSLSMKEYIEEKVSKIEKLTDHILDVAVRIDLYKMNHSVDITVKFSHVKVKVGAVTDEMYSAIDKAFAKLYAKLHHWKDRIQDHHNKSLSAVEMQVHIFEGLQAEERENDQEIIAENNRHIERFWTLPKVLQRETRPLKMLTLQEAVMKMELSGDHFLLYRSEEDHHLKVMYRRKDGNYGLMSPDTGHSIGEKTI